MFQVWTDKSQADTFAAISGVTQHYPEHIPQIIRPDDDPSAAVVLVMGTALLNMLAESKLIPKNRTITSLRNKVWLAPDGTKFVFTYSPGIGNTDHSATVDLLCDVRLAYRVALTGTETPEIGKYRYVDDFSDAIDCIKKKLLSTDAIACTLDTETVGLDPYAPGVYPVAIQFTHEEGMADVVTFSSKEEYDFRMGGELGEHMRWLLNQPSIKMRGANLKYDLNWLWVHGQFECSNFTMDTTAVGSCLDENRSNSLNVHAKVYTDMGGYDDQFNATVDKGRMDLALEKDPEGFLVYSGGDTDACLRASNAMAKDICKNKPLARFYTTILHPALRAFEKVEQAGVLVDTAAYMALNAKLEAQMMASIKTMKEIAGGRLLAKHQDSKKFGGLNPNKAAFLIDYLFGPMGLNLTPRQFTAAKGTPSTAMDHIEQFEDHPKASDFVKALKDYVDAAKTKQTYVEGFLQHLRADGRFHPSYWLFAGDKHNKKEGGTITGRLSCKDPAFQTIPKHTKWAHDLRLCFIAPPGYRILENDYSQGELRVIACIADEPNMIAAYAQDMDLHALTAGPFRGYNYEEMMALKHADPKLFKAIRQLGKAGNFGLIYGMSALGFEGVGGFIAYARDSYRVHLTEKEATEFRNGFFARYPVLLDYHDEYKAHARKHGWVMSPLGRVRHLPLIKSPDSFTRSKSERQAVNSPVQSTLSDMMIWAIAIGHQRGWSKESPCFGMVHDAKYTYVPEDNWEFYAAREKEVMENLPFHKLGWEPQLAFPVDGTIGQNLGEMEEFQLAA